MPFNIFDNSIVEQDYQYISDSIGLDVLLNGEPIRAVITNTNLEQNYDDKRISSLSYLPRGGIVEYNDNKYMLISEQADKRYTKWKGVMRQLSQSIVINNNCSFINVDCYFESERLGLNVGQVITMSNDKFTVNMQDNEYTQQIAVDNRFIKYGFAYKVIGIDKLTQKGIISLLVEKDLINPANDDLVNEIAGGKSCSVTITNTQPVELFEDATVQLTWNATSDFSVVFTSSDESIATVDATGLVTAIGVGEVTITVANATSPTINDTIDITVLEASPEYHLVIKSTSSTPNEIRYGREKDYYVEVYDGTNLVENETVAWQLFADDQTSTTNLSTIISQSGTGCIVKNNDVYSGYCYCHSILPRN